MKVFAYAASVALLSATAAFAQPGSPVAIGQTQSTEAGIIDSGGKANRIAPMDNATAAELRGITLQSIANPPTGSGLFDSGGKANRMAPMNTATAAELQGTTPATEIQWQSADQLINSGGRANRLAPMDAATRAELQGAVG